MRDFPTPDSATTERIKHLLGPDGWKAGADAASYLDDPRGRFSGHAHLVALPKDTGQVAQLLRLCNDAKIGVIPYGGGTGVVAGQLSIHNGNAVIISLERMNKLRDISVKDGIITVEAGCILQDVHDIAEDKGMVFPLSMASRGSCQIGGNLATNAGGIQVLRDGNTRDLCLGIEAVFPDGSILGELSPLRKNNIGYDLRHLLIGSEGTLGIITAATMMLRPIDAETVTVFCGIASPAHAVELLTVLRRDLGQNIAALELMSDFGVQLVLESFPDLQNPLQDRYPWYLVMEFGGDQGIRARAEDSLSHSHEAGLWQDAAIAESGAQREAIWNLRELTPEANRLNGAICSSDTSVPISRIEQFITDTRQALSAIHPGLQVNSYGHIGDGNIHHNVFSPKGVAKADFLAENPGINDRVRLAITQVSHRLGGSISAEHGIGRLKTDDLTQFASPVRLDLMRRIKSAIDPNHIMNPGALVAAPP